MPTATVVTQGRQLLRHGSDGTVVTRLPRVTGHTDFPSGAAPAGHSTTPPAHPCPCFLLQVRAWGLSNETSWGVMQHCAVADALGVPRPATIQVRSGPPWWPPALHAGLAWSELLALWIMMGKRPSHAALRNC